MPGERGRRRPLDLTSEVVPAGFAGKIDFRRGRRAIEKVFSSFEPAASQVGKYRARARRRKPRAAPTTHHGPRYLEIKTVRTDQEHANQRGVHCCSAK